MLGMGVLLVWVAGDWAYCSVRRGDWQARAGYGAFVAQAVEDMARIGAFVAQAAEDMAEIGAFVAGIEVFWRVCCTGESFLCHKEWAGRRRGMWFLSGGLWTGSRRH